MKEQERKKLAAAKVRAKKAAEEAKVQKRPMGEKNKWGYHEKSKGGQLCIFVAKQKNGATIDQLKKQSWVSPRHIQVFNELTKRGGKKLKDGRMILK